MSRFTRFSILVAALFLFAGTPSFAINQCTCQVGVVTRAINPATGWPYGGIDKRSIIKGDGYGCYVACRKAAAEGFAALNCGAVTKDNGLGQQETALCTSFNRYLQFFSPAP